MTKNCITDLLAEGKRKSQEYDQSGKSIVRLLWTAASLSDESERVHLVRAANCFYKYFDDSKVDIDFLVLQLEHVLNGDEPPAVHETPQV